MSSTELALMKYESKEPAQFGTSLMEGLVAAAAMAEEANKLSEQAAQGTQYLSFELTKALFDFDERFEDVDVHTIFSPKSKDVERFNTRVLVHMGVLKRILNNDDEVEYIWTSTKIKELYEYTAELKDANPEEHLKRFNNRKRLNMKLSEAAKAACALKDQGLKIDDLYYTEHPDTKAMTPTIRNAPKEISGDLKEVQLGARKTVAGASLSPTMSSLIKLATNRHKPKDVEGTSTETQTGVANINITDEDFGAVCNQVIRVVNAQENEFSAEKLTHLRNLSKFLAEAMKTAKEKKPEVKQVEAKTSAKDKKQIEG